MNSTKNNITVLKFGGTSVATPERMNTIVSIAKTFPKTVIVLSALSGTTDALIAVGRASALGNITVVNRKLSELRNRHIAFSYDLIQNKTILIKLIAKIERIFTHAISLCTGEITQLKLNELSGIGEFLSTNLFYALLQELSVNSELLNSPDFVVLNSEDEPDMDFMKTKFQRHFSNSETQISVMQGFVCRNSNGDISCFSRGGSDYTATLIGAAANAAEIQIWTDIDGMQTADPRVVAGTLPVRVLNYAEAAELAYFGAKILHPSTIHPAALANIPVRLKNTMKPESPGTVIGDFTHQGASVAVAAKKNITAIKIRSHRMLNAYGYLARIFEVFAKHRTSIDLITTSEVAVSLTIDNIINLEAIVIELNLLGRVEVEHNLAVISVVGNFPASRPGDASLVFGAVKHIPVRMISYGGSEHNISLLVSENLMEETMSCLHDVLFIKSQSHVESSIN